MTVGSRAKSRGQLRRDWNDAREAHHWPGLCIVCGSPAYELAHVIGRAHDQEREHERCRGRGCIGCDWIGRVLWVDPLDVTPLCRSDHTAYDHHKLNLRPYLSATQLHKATCVADSEESAMRRIESRR